MNTDNNSTTGNDFVSRLLNVVVSEVLLSVDSRLNAHLIALNNRITQLERDNDDTLCPEDIRGIKLSLEEVREDINRLSRRIDGIDDKFDDLDVDQKIEDALCDLDVDSKVESAVGDLDLTAQVVEVISCMRSDAIHELIGDEVKEIVREEIDRTDVTLNLNAADVVTRGLNQLINGPKI